MKKFLVLVALAVMAAPAFAQVDTDPDGVGIYFDTEGVLVCNETFMPGMGLLSAHLLITNPTGADVVGFEGEAVLETDMAFSFSAWAAATGGINAATAPEFYVAWTTPVLPVGNAIEVANFNSFPISGTYAKFYLKPYIVPSVPGYLVYIESADPGRKILLQVPTGDYQLPVATVGMACDVVDTEDTSWGQVKSLF